MCCLAKCFSLFAPEVVCIDTSMSGLHTVHGVAGNCHNGKDIYIPYHSDHLNLNSTSNYISLLIGILELSTCHTCERLGMSFRTLFPLGPVPALACT